MLNKLRQNIDNKTYIKDFLKLHSEYVSSFPRIGLNNFEAFSLYSFIRTYKPKKIFEMSPDMGWSTLIMSAAILAENYENEIIFFKLFDLENKLTPQTTEFINKISNYQFIEGDAMSNINLDKESLDFWFIDSNHSMDFANWYIKYIEKSDYIFIHDIDPSEDYHKKFRPTDSCVHAGGEPLVFYEYLKNKKYFQTEETLYYDLWNHKEELGNYRPYWSHLDKSENDKLYWNFTEQLKFNENNHEFNNGNNRSVLYYTK